MFTEMITTAAIAAAITVGLAVPAHAEDTIETSPTTVTVEGIAYPVCSEEDCSDQLGQIGVWFSPTTGKAWLSQGETSVEVRCSDICLGA